MKHFFRFSLAVLLLFSFCSLSPAIGKAKIEVVTTIPVETILTPMDTKPAASVWLDMVKTAKKSIDWACFYFSTQENQPLEPVIEAIIDAAQRGVKVRFLLSTPVNHAMAQRNNEVLKRFKTQRNIEVVEFNWKSLTGGINHAKYFVVDQKEIYVGSQNFDWRSLKHIHETGLRIEDSAIARNLGRIFEADRLYNKGDKEAYKKFNEKKLKKQAPGKSGGKNYIVASPEAYNPPGIKDSLLELIRLIDGAKKKITVQLLNYHIDVYKSSEKFTIIDDALRRAAARGVDVKLLVSDWNKRRPGVNGLKALVKVPGIQVRFATIPRYSKGFIPYARVIHSKVMRVDNKVSWVGTSNWGKGYFYGSRNIEVVCREPAVANTLDRLFEQLWNSRYCYPVEPQKEYSVPRIGE